MKKNFILTFIFGLLVSNLFSQITISTTTTRCTGANANTYTLSGNLTFSSPPATGYLTVSVEGGHSQVFNAPFTSPLSYSIQKLIADGATRNVTATFSATGTTGSNSFTAPSSVGTGFSNFPINTVVTNLLWGTNPYPQQSWDNGYVPGFGGPFDFSGGIHDLDLTPPGVTDIAAVCGELAEGIAGGAGSNYYSTYRYVPLEYLARGTAGEANESQNIPTGGIGRVRAGMLRFLFDTYYTSTNANNWTTENGAAFQLAVWEIIHEKYTSNNTFSVKTASTNGFYFLATYNLTSLNQAETYVAAVNAKNWTDAQWMAYQPVNWHVIAIENNSAYGGNDGQDLVFAQPIVGSCACTPPTLGGATSVCIGSTASVTPATGGTWTSSNTAIATVTNAGIVTGVAAGTVTLTFTNTTTLCSNSKSFTVNALPTLGGQSAVCVGSTATVTPTTGGTWISSNTGVATVSNAGVVTGIAAGTVTLTFTNSTTGCSNTISFSVNNCNADLAVVKTVSDSNPIVGSSVNFVIKVTNNGSSNATGVVVNDKIPSGYTYSGNNSGGSYNSSTGIWSVGNLANGSSVSLTITATVKSNGNYINTATVTGNESDPNLSNNTSSVGVTVDKVIVSTAKVISGGLTTIPANTFFTYSILYSVSSLTAPTGYNIYIEDYLDPDLSWNPADVIGASSFDPLTGKVVINLNNVNSGTSGSRDLQVKFKGCTGGSIATNFATAYGDNIMGTSGQYPIVTNTVSITSTDRVVLGGSNNICAGSTANVTPATGGIWTSSNNAIATVTNAGLVTGVATGNVTLTYTETATGCSSSKSFTVNALPTLGGQSAVCVGSTANVTPSSGGTWNSSNTAIATVTNEGVVTGVTAGTVTLTYTSTAGCVNTKSFTVNVLSTLGGASSVAMGSTANVTPATGGTWSSSNTAVATVTNDGVVTGVSTGTVTLTFTNSTGCSQTMSFTVFPTVILTGTTTVAENSGTAKTLTATLSVPTTTATTVTLTYTGTATGGGTDYTASSTTITIPAGSTTGTVTITPVDDAVYEGNETVIADITSVTGGNGATESGTQTATITIIENDNAIPVANNDIATTTEDTPVSFNVTTNDTDVDGTINVATVDLDPATSGTQTTFTVSGQGTYTVNSAGVVTFTPVANYNGTATAINYTVTDNSGTVSNAATITVTVTAVNDAPVANNDAATTTEDTPVSFNVTTNDTDVDGTINVATVDLDPATLGIQTTFTVTGQGTYTVNTSGVVTFTPVANYNGTATAINYTVNDNSGATSNIATITVTVTAVNDAPVAVNDAGSVNEDATLTVAAAGALSNDTDSDTGATKTVTAIRTGNTEGNGTAGTLGTALTGTYGTLTINADGSYVYVANNANILPAGATAHDYFNYTMSDGTASDVAVIDITITGTNDPPQAINDVNTTFINMPVSGKVLTNDSDPEGDILIVTAETIATTGGGSVTILADGTYTYTPTSTFTGEDTFTYTVCDNGTPSLCDIATVTIEVMPIPVYGNDNPVAVNDAYQGTINKTVVGTVISNDFDVDGNGLTVIGDAAGKYDSDGNGTPDTQLPIGTAQAVAGVNSAGDPVTNAGSLTLNTDGTFTFVPVNGFTGQVTYTYVISDGNTGTDDAVVTIDITAQYANAVFALNDAAKTLINTPVSSNVLGNDYDPQGDIMTVSNPGTVTTASGELVIAANGTYTFTPATGFTGDYTYTYTVCDNGTPQACDQATLTITVVPAPTENNDPPVALNNAYLTAVNTTVNGTILPNDSDPDNNPLTVTAGTYDSNGDGTQDGTLPVGTPQTVGGINSSGQAVANAGQLTQNADGTFSFVPANGFTGQVTYGYTISDGFGGTDTALVTIDITNGNTTFATDDSYILNQGIQITGNILTNDYDPQGNTQTVNTTPVVAPLHGTLILNANGTFTYTPNPGFTGTDQFVYEVCDNGTPMACDRATVYLNIATLPDVTPVITAVPNVMNGVTNFYITVQITELNNVNTSGTITVKIPKDTRWVLDGAYDPNLTTLGSTTLNNNVWSYSSDATYHIFTTNSVISAGSYSYFGFRAIWNAGQTVGIYTITSQIVEGSGGENRIDNNVDAEKIDYFIF